MSTSPRSKTLLTRFIGFLTRLWSGIHRPSRPSTGITSQGERAVAIGGNVEHSTIHTGDTYHISPNPNELHLIIQEAIQATIQQNRETLPNPSLLSPTEYTRWLESPVLVAGHTKELVGRASQLSALQAILAGTCRVVLVHGAGGIGKTRFLRALSEAVSQEMHLWFASPGIDGETLARALAQLDAQTRHLIMVDDVERMPALHHLYAILLNPLLVSRVQLVLTARSAFKDTILDALPVLSEEHLSVLELPPLSPEAIDTYLQQPPHTIESEDTRALIIQVAGGNPLFASIAAQLAKRGIPLAHLTHDQAFSRYLEQLIRDLRRADNALAAYALSYLRVLAVLGTIEQGNEPLHTCLRQELGIPSVSIEEQLIEQLVRAGLVQPLNIVLKLSSQVLADHLLFSHFFAPTANPATFRQQILEPFFHFKPKEILTSLARAEVIGGATAAGEILNELVAELRYSLPSAGPTTRLLVLSWLEDLAFLRPDAILDVVDPLIGGDEQRREILEDPFFGTFTIDHVQVLDHVVDLVRTACYRGNIPDCISYLRTLSLYRPKEQTYASVRGKARAALIRLAKFQPGASYTVQRTILDTVTLWLEQDMLQYFDLSITLLQTILQVELEEARVSPLGQPQTITISHGVIAPNETLRTLRLEIENLLFKIYTCTTTLAQRLTIVQTLEGALPPVLPSGKVPEEMCDWLQADAERTALFFKDVVLPQEEFPVLEKVSAWLWRARHFSGYSGGIFDQLRQMLADHDLYQFYRILAGKLWLNEEDEADWEAGQAFRRQAIEHYLETLTPTTINLAVHDLALVAEQALASGNTDTPLLDSLLEDLGKRAPTLALQVIEQALANHLALRSSLDALLRGLRVSDQRAALLYMKEWTESSDVQLIEAVIRSYYAANWDTLSDEEWDLLRQLVAKGIPSVNYNILSLIPSLASHRPEMAVKLMTAIAASGDKYQIRRIAEILGRSGPTLADWAIEIANAQDLFELCSYVVQLPTLDGPVLPCLKRLSQVTPMGVVYILEGRIRQSTTAEARDSHYIAIPLELADYSDDIRFSAEYPNVLTRIRDWMLHDELHFRHVAPYALKAIAGSLDEVLYDVLLEWAASDDPQKQQAVADLLEEFNSGELFYRLCRQLLLQDANEVVEQAVADAILRTPWGEWNSTNNWQEERRKALSSWLQDSTTRIRRFAQRLLRSF